MNSPREILQARLTELAEQTRRDDAFLEILDSSDPMTPELFLTADQQYGSTRTSLQSFNLDPYKLAQHRHQLGKNGKLLPPLTRGIAGKIAQERIGIIADEFLFKSFDGLANFVIITPANYKDVGPIDILLVVSTWRGVDGESWVGLATPHGPVQSFVIEEILPYFRSQDIPVVFYSKEDPPNYNYFLPLAQSSDIIFTSAAEVVPKYEADAPFAESISVLPFGINPLHHSPIGHRNGTNKVVPFAGSWFRHKYKSRANWGSIIFDGVTKSQEQQLLIFDRNSNQMPERYRFPAKYIGSIMPAISHDELLSLLRLSDIAVNLNSVQNSTTMFANRAVELQATGTFIISNYNSGLNSYYPHIHMANSTNDVASTLNVLDLHTLRSVQSEGIRHVFSRDLAFYRIDEIIRSVGLTPPERKFNIAAVAPKVDQKLREDLYSQSYGQIEILSETEFLANKHEFDIKVELSSELEYGPYYIQDMVNAFHYVDSLTVQKTLGSIEETDSSSHLYTDNPAEPGTAAHFLATPNTAVNSKNYCIDNFQVGRRNQAPIVLQSRPQTPKFSVVVPIYNNGNHLEHKCFASLRRSSMFSEMEIIFVDDGSTDPLTHEVIDRLERSYHNVSVFKFAEGGSGSASRPRNKGLELASTEYITYLDPDNEALNDGFARLWLQLQTTDADFALGNMSRWRAGHGTSRYTSVVRSRLGIDTDDDTFSVTANSIVDLGFVPMSIQATMSRTSWLRRIGITQPIGAVGQDSFFFQQMFYYATKISLVDTTIHTYYGEVADSVVNTISAKFFEKYRPLENARSDWLRTIGLLEEYKASRLEVFFKGWYLTKLALVKSEEIEQATSTVLALGQMYGEYRWQDPVVIDFWLEHGYLSPEQAAELKETSELA